MELQNALTVANLNYEIWWLYKEKESRKRFVDTFNSYPLFFQTSLHAHFLAMIVALYRLFETRTDTINMPQLLNLIKEMETIPVGKIQKFEREFQEIKPLWIKISILRNHQFGHRSNALEHDAIWERANVTPNEIKTLIVNSKRILNEMSHAWDKSSHAFNLSATEDTLQLLEDLKQMRDKNLNDSTKSDKDYHQGSKKKMSTRDFKIIAATLTIVGAILSILDRVFTPHHLLLESSPDYPNVLRTLGWIFLLVPPLIYIALDFPNLFPLKKKETKLNDKNL